MKQIKVAHTKTNKSSCSNCKRILKKDTRVLVTISENSHYAQCDNCVDIDYLIEKQSDDEAFHAAYGHHGQI